MTSRIGTPGWMVILLASGTSCVDHPMITVPAPVEETGAGVVLYASLNTYPVSGADPQSIAMSVSGGGSMADGQRRFIGYHHWNITWQLEPRARDGECAIADATVFLDSRITLPQWDAPPNPDAGLKAQWNEFAAALHEHELGHQVLVLSGARRVRQTLLAVRAPRCDDIVARADSAGHQVLEEIRTQDARYDLETRHGASQGAIWLPPSRRR